MVCGYGLLVYDIIAVVVLLRDKDRRLDDAYWYKLDAGGHLCDLGRSDGNDLTVRQGVHLRSRTSQLERCTGDDDHDDKHRDGHDDQDDGRRRGRRRPSS